MEASLSTLLADLGDVYAVTVLGVHAPVVDAVAASRPGCRTELVPRVRSKRHLGAIAAHVWAVRSLRPDLLLASLSTLYDGQYGLLAAIVTGTPTVAMVHCVLPPVSRRQSWLFRALHRRVGAIGGVSGAVAGAVEQALGFQAGKVSVLYNGVPDRWGDGDPGGGGAGARGAGDSGLGVAAGPQHDGRFVIGAVGRLVPEKGYADLLRALTELRECRLVLVGDGPQRSELEALGRELGISGRTELSGWVDPPWTSVGPIDLVAAPSYVEGFGLVPVEAMLARIPVVASAVGGMAEVVRDGETGLLVPPGDPAALAGAIRRVLSDDALRAHLVAAGRADAVARFSTRSMVEAYERLFDGVLGADVGRATSSEPGSTRGQGARSDPR